jgi:hypothetical protein
VTEDELEDGLLTLVWRERPAHKRYADARLLLARQLAFALEPTAHEAYFYRHRAKLLTQASECFENWVRTLAFPTLAQTVCEVPAGLNDSVGGLNHGLTHNHLKGTKPMRYASAAENCTSVSKLQRRDEKQCTRTKTRFAS